MKILPFKDVTFTIGGVQFGDVLAEVDVEPLGSQDPRPSSYSYTVILTPSRRARRALDALVKWFTPYARGRGQKKPRGRRAKQRSKELWIAAALTARFQRRDERVAAAEEIATMLERSGRR